MNDQRFFDLAMKTIAHQATDAEQVELNALLTSHPELKSELERLRTEAALAKEVLPLAAAADSTGGQFPAYARERLLTKVRQTLGESRPASAKQTWGWLLGLSGVAAAVVLLAVLSSRPPAPVIEVALLDTAGVVRDSETNETAAFRQQWARAKVEIFSKPADLDAWQNNRNPAGKVVVKVLYDRAAGEVRVTLFGVGKPFLKTFIVERELATTLREADTFIREQTGQ